MTTRWTPGASAGVDMEPLMVATRTINAVIGSSLATVDARLTMPQLRVMVILSRLRSASLSEVANRLGVDQSNASRTCDQLVKRGMVARDEDPRDRRRLSLTLSPSGHRVERQVMDRRRRLLEDIVSAMPFDERQALMAALTSFNQATERTGAASETDPPSSGRIHRWLT